MTSIQGSFEVDTEKEQISLLGIFEKPIKIDYSGDIDLTDLVQKLAEKIDEKELIQVDQPESNDKKVDLLLSTVIQIIKKYNDSLNLQT